MITRRNRKGTNCLRCRTQKRKCDMKSPCIQCIKAHKETECRRVVIYKSDVPSLNHPNYVDIKPNADIFDQSVQNASAVKDLTKPSKPPAPNPSSPGPGPRPERAPENTPENALYAPQGFLNRTTVFSPTSPGTPGLSIADLTNMSNMSVLNSVSKHQTLQPGSLNIQTPSPSDAISLECDSTFSEQENDSTHKFGQRSSVRQSPLVLDQLIYNTVSIFSVQDLLNMVPMARQMPTLKPLDPRVINLMNELPRKQLCDTLVAHFFDTFVHIFCAIHPGWFHENYTKFWQSGIYDVDLGFISMLFAILASSGQEIPPEQCEEVQVDVDELRQLPAIWYGQCLLAMEMDSNQTNILHIMTFMILQTYFHPIKEYKELDRLLKRSISVAKKLNLKSPLPGEDARMREMRLRAHWGLFSCDTFQGLSLNRTPYISYSDMEGSSYITHCNDDDISPQGVTERPLNECTESSTFYFCTKFLFICKELWDENGNITTDPLKAIEVDKKIVAFRDHLPWHIKPKKDGKLPTVPKRFRDHYYVLNIFWSCMHTQRFRLHRAHLYPRNEYCYKACIDSAKDVLSVYRNMRRPENAFLTKGMFMAISYNVFSASVAELFFALVELPENHVDYTQDARYALEDFKIIKNEGKVISKLVTEGIDVLERLLDVYDIVTGKKIASDLARFQDYKSNLASNISHLFGGKKVTEQYLNRLSIDYLVGDKAREGGNEHENSPALAATTTDQNGSSFFSSSDWNWINGNSFEQWNLDDWQYMFQERITRSQAL